MPSFAFPPEIVQLILNELRSPRDVASLAQVCKQTNYQVTPALYRTVAIKVNGPKGRLKALKVARGLSSNSANLQLVKVLTVYGYWRYKDEVQRQGRRQNVDISEIEKLFAEAICNAIPLMKNLTSFKWRIVAYFPPMLGPALLRHDSLREFEGFVDPQIETLKVEPATNGLYTDCYPASIIPIGLRNLTSLHVLQLGTFRDCSYYGDIIHASPGLRSLWVDISPTFQVVLAGVEPQYADVLSLLLRQQVRIYSSMPWSADGAKLKLTDLRLSHMRITMAGVLALQENVDLNYVENLVFNLCGHEELIPFITRRTPNLRHFREDEEDELLYLEEFLRYQAGSMEVHWEENVTPSKRHKRPLQSLWISCAMSRDDGLDKLSPYLKVAGGELRTLCLDVNWGEFENPEEVLGGCYHLEELAVWIECEGDQWEDLGKAICHHRTLRELCIFNTSGGGEPLSDKIKSRLYSCVKSNRLGHSYLHRDYNEDGENVGDYQGSYNFRGTDKVGNLRRVAVRHDLLRIGLVLTIWKVLVVYEKELVRMVETDSADVEGTSLFDDVMQVEYFYPEV